MVRCPHCEQRFKPLAVRVQPVDDWSPVPLAHLDTESTTRNVFLTTAAPKYPTRLDHVIALSFLATGIVIGFAFGAWLCYVPNGAKWARIARDASPAVQIVAYEHGGLDQVD